MLEKVQNLIRMIKKKQLLKPAVFWAKLCIMRDLIALDSFVI